MQFQSTLPRRERRHPSCPVRHPRQHFNPRSREGSDGGGRMVAPLDAISIHAPAKGATLNPPPNAPRSDISIHAPAKGATRSVPELDLPCRNFNPRSREGSDGKLHRLAISKFAISTHAPAKGATFEIVERYRNEDDFNPRSREGSDVILFVSI